MELDRYIIDSGATLLDAAHAIAQNRSRCVVVANGGKVVGVFSEGDLVRALLRGADIHSPIFTFIRHGLSFLRERNMNKALEMFRTYGVSLIPILTDELQLKDVITLQQLLKEVTLVQDQVIN